MLTHYEDMKGDEKCKNWGVWGWGVMGHSRSSETSLFDRAYLTSYSTLIETMRLSCTVFELLGLSLISQNLKTSCDHEHAHSIKGQSVILMIKHHMPNQCIKFEVSSFSRSGDILGGSKKLHGSHDHNHAPFGGDFLFVW